MSSQSIVSPLLQARDYIKEWTDNAKKATNDIKQSALDIASVWTDSKILGGLHGLAKKVADDQKKKSGKTNQDSFNGQLQLAKKQIDKLKSQIGKPIMEIETSALKVFTNNLAKLIEVMDKHPQIAKTAAYIGLAIGGTIALGKTVFQLKNVYDSVKEGLKLLNPFTLFRKKNSGNGTETSGILKNNMTIKASNVFLSGRITQGSGLGGGSGRRYKLNRNGRGLEEGGGGPGGTSKFAKFSKYAKFGGKALGIAGTALSLGTMLPDIMKAKNLSGVVDAVGSGLGVSKKGGKGSALSGALTGASMGMMFGPIGGAVGAAIGGAVGFIGMDKVKKFGGALSQAGSKAWSAVTSVGSKAWGTISNAGSKTWNGVTSAGSKAWGAISKVGSKTWNGVTSSGSKAWGSISKAGSKTWNAVTSAGSKAWGSISKVGSKTWNGVTSAGSKAWGSISKAGTKTWNGVTSAGSKAWGSISKVGSKTWNAISNVGSKSWGIVSKTAKSNWDLITGIGKTYWETWKGVGQGAWQLIKDIGSGNLSDIGKDALKIWDSLLGGFKSAWGTIKDWATNNPIVNGVVSNVKSFFGINESHKKGSHKHGSHKNGLSYVPFDGYIAELHKGERVLTAKENQELTQNRSIPFIARTNSNNGTTIQGGVKIIIHASNAEEAEKGVRKALNLDSKYIASRGRRQAVWEG